MSATVLVKLILLKNRSSEPVLSATFSEKRIKLRKLTLVDDWSPAIYNLHELHKIIFKSFPELFGHTYSLYWLDSQKDRICIDDATDLDLCLRISESLGSYPNIAIQPTTSTEDTETYGFVRHEVLCDGCDKRLYGSRFRCLQCEDYDLCDKCFGNTAHDPDHRFKLLYNPRGSRSPSCCSSHIEDEEAIVRNSVLQSDAQTLTTAVQTDNQEEIVEVPENASDSLLPITDNFGDFVDVGMDRSMDLMDIANALDNECVNAESQVQSEYQSAAEDYAADEYDTSDEWIEVDVPGVHALSLKSADTSAPRPSEQLHGNQ